MSVRIPEDRVRLVQDSIPSIRVPIYATIYIYIYIFTAKRNGIRSKRFYGVLMANSEPMQAN